MKRAFYYGVAFLLFFSILSGIGKNENVPVTSQIIQKKGNLCQLNAVSLPDKAPFVLPDIPLALTDPNKSEKENKFKFSFFPGSGIQFILNHNYLNPPKRITNSCFQISLFILFRNLRL